MADEQDPQRPPPPAEALAAPVESAAVRRLGECLPAAIEEIRYWSGAPIVRVRREALEKALRFLRDDPDCLMDHLSTMFATHFPDRAAAPLEATYCLYSLAHRCSVTIKAGTDEATPLASAVGIWPIADWHEREAFDLVGVMFSGRSELTRILLPDDWVGHPLRKDYPLEGRPGDHKTYRTE